MQSGSDDAYKTSTGLKSNESINDLILAVFLKLAHINCSGKNDVKNNFRHSQGLLPCFLYTTSKATVLS